MHLDNLKKAFDEHGLVLVKTDIARKDEMVAEAAANAERGARLLKEITGRDVCYDKGLPLKPFSDTFQVTDFAYRAHKRFDIRLATDSVVRSFPENLGVLTVARKLLGTEDVRVLDVGLVVACPNAKMQHWHKDDSSSNNNALGIFFPLVPEPDRRFGTAEFQLGSHVYGDHNPSVYYDGENPDATYMTAPLLNGEFLVYDYLTSHRGTPNVHESESRPLLWVVLGGPDYENDFVNWAPKGCEIDTQCGREEVLYSWSILDPVLGGERMRPQFLEDWFAYLQDEEDEYDWRGLKDYTEEQFLNYYIPGGLTTDAKYKEGFNMKEEGGEL